MSTNISCWRDAESSEASFSKARLLASRSISPVGVTLRKSCERMTRIFNFMAISILRDVPEVTDVSSGEDRAFADHDLARLLFKPPTKSGHATLVHWYSTARVSKRLCSGSTACLRARYCTNLAWFDLAY